MMTSGGTTAAPAIFLSPACTWIGPGALTSLANGLISAGTAVAGPVLVAADIALVKNNLLDGALDALQGAGYEPTVLSDFGPELTAVQVDAAATTAREIGAVAVVGIGGGSVLDAAKMIALLVTNQGNSSDWFGVVEPSVTRPPLVLVPTTIGTGAEVTRISMITEGGEKRIASSQSFVPQLVVLDQELVASLPPHVKASTGLDALAHAVESILSKNSTVMTEHNAVETIRITMTDLVNAYDGDPDATGRMLFAAYLAGLALNSGVVLGHSLGYAINHEKPMPHGTTTGLALAYTIAYNQYVDERKAKLLARALTLGGSEDLRVAAEHVLALVRRVGQPATLDEAGVPAGVDGEVARRTVELYPRPANPESMDTERVHALLSAMRDGDLDKAFAVTARKDARP
ncbi:iron-containing alcohol dehydrogenase [Cryobacterium sp. Y11]|uniref:iron-containing alcohol dehydrogenase n=1 Tax=Cryobacterium sp. Y11 TaxID=2045016 RepID=UPI000CE4EB30|nr:iron-containing alcohol dehydrogenase [Cryobacterium sp. Y11]